MTVKIWFGTRSLEDFDYLFSELNKINKDAWKFSHPPREESGDTIIEVDKNSIFLMDFLKMKFVKFP